MSVKFQERTKDTEFGEGNIVSGNQYDIFHCDKSLPPASVSRFSGFINDTIDPELLEEHSSFEAEREDIHKDAPAGRIPKNEQRGFSLTFQRWKGIVKEISEKTFIAQLSDLSNNSPEEQAEFFREEIREDDKELLSVGAVFYWCIGYLITSSGQQMRASFLRFQRLPLFTKESIKITAAKIRNIKKNITWL